MEETILLILSTASDFKHSIHTILASNSAISLFAAYCQSATLSLSGPFITLSNENIYGFYFFIDREQ